MNFPFFEKFTLFDNSEATIASSSTTYNNLINSHRRHNNNMAIKVIVGEQKTQNEKPFPKLMKHTDGTITRFKAPHIGAHIHDPNNRLVSKESVFVELEGISMANYSDFDGSITLQNE